VRTNEKLDIAVRQTHRLEKLIENLLDVSRIATGQLKLELEEFDVCDAVRDVVRRLGEDAERAGCKLELHADKPAFGKWDRLRVEQVATNLFSNAIKYAAGKPIEISLESDANIARLRVHDHGIGIGPESISRIFDRFERAVSARHFGGLGMGLYITRQIVEAHGGAIFVTSELGVGSTFTVELPQQPVETAVSAVATPAASSSDGNSNALYFDCRGRSRHQQFDR
jgi:signal transduction histidine kinase